MGEWEKRKIGSLGRLVTGKTPSTKETGHFGGDYPFITIPDLDGRVYIGNSERTLSEQGAESVRSSLIPKNAVMMSCIATIGKCGITTRASFTNQQINSVICNSDVDPLFLYYIFTQLGHALESAGGGGSVYTNVSKSRFADIEINLPPLPEQKAIAEILGTLDDKIELNRRMNETLEAMARAIFKSWFVDFDPVHAKAKGRQPDGMDAETAKLFPSSFEDSEIGPVPKGWKVGAFSETVDILSGGTPKTTVAEFWGGDIPWFSVVDAPNESDVFVVATERTITQAGVNASATQVLLRGTTIISARGTVGKVCIAGVPMAMNQSCYGLRGKVGINQVFTYYSTRFLVSTLQNHSHGSVFATITRNTFDGISVTIPPPPLVQVFENTVQPLFDRIHSNLLEAQFLATMRDALLPRLLSGEITVPASRVA